MREMSVAEQRYQAVLAVIADGLGVTQAAERSGCLGRRCMPGWRGMRLRAWKGWSIDRIGRRRVRIRCRPRSRRRCWSCGDHGRIGVRAGWCSSWPSAAVSPVPSASAAYRALLRAGMIEAGAPRQAVTQVETVGTRPPMELWQMDVVGGFPLADGPLARRR